MTKMTKKIAFFRQKMVQKWSKNGPFDLKKLREKHWKMPKMSKNVEKKSRFFVKKESPKMTDVDPFLI